MKIAFDGQPLLNANKTGIAYYEDGLVKGMLKYYPENEYQLDVFTFRGREEKIQYLEEYGEFITKNECTHFPGSLFRMLSMFFPIPYSLFFRRKSDITHFCNYVIPFGVRGKKIVTVHDLAFREYPETIRKRTLLMLKSSLKRSIRRADAILADSEFTKQEILKYYNVPEEKIYVVPCGIDTNKFYPIEDQAEIERTKEKYGIHGEYYLYLGTLEPRKNIEGILEAYGKLKKDSEEPIPKMVIAGGKGWLFDSIFEKVKKQNLEEDVIFTGYVDETDKVQLLNGAMAFCFPSFYEGFGMPPMEAMACGTAVITSNGNSLFEVTGEAAIHVEPTDISQISEALRRVWKDEVYRKELEEKGFEQVKMYSWKKAVDALYKVYEDVAK
mgnify:FL=1